MQRILVLPLACLLFCSCNSNNHSAKNTEVSTASSSAGPWYRRYTGTIAGQQVVVNLHSYGGRSAEDGLIPSGGNYYYKGKSQIIDLNFESEDNRYGTAVFTEVVSTDRDDQENDSPPAPQWRVSFGPNTITGKWKSADGKKTYDINLTENYDSAYRFDILSLRDSTCFKGKAGNWWLQTEYDLLTPAANMNSDDAGFITNALLHELGGDTLHAHNLNQYVAARNMRDFDEYKQSLAEGINDSIEETEANNWDEAVNSTCEYNDNGIVVFSFNTYNYSGGAHGNYFSTTVCLDIKNRKTLHLSDIVTVDSVKLSALLEEQARKAFHMSSTDSLNSRLLVDTIPPTHNFIISDRGLTFCYSPYEIASFVDGYVYLFIPYTGLGDLLKPEFKTRMNI